MEMPERVAPIPSPGRPPATRQDNVREILHGVEIVDPYRWLEDDESPETRAWIDAQNEDARALLEGLPPVDPIRERLTALMWIDTVGGPPVRNATQFFFEP